MEIMDIENHLDSSLQFERIEKLVNYYFSDFNLNRDKFLRSNLSDNGISIDCLLTFKKLNEVVNGNKEVLLNFLQNWQNSSVVEFVEATESIRRKVDCPFVYDKHYLRNNCDRILYISKLPEGSSLEDIECWAQCFDRVSSIQGIKRVNGNSIRSALIVFCSSETVTSIIQQKESILFKKVNNSNGTKIQLMFYRNYLTLKNKIRKKCKTKRLIENDLANLSISDQSTSVNTTTTNSTIGNKTPFGMVNLVGKRTLLLKCDDDSTLTIRMIKSILAKHGLLYVYQISLEQKHYYLLFKNRTNFLSFLQLLQNQSKIEFVDATTDVNVSLDTDQFSPINLTQLPQHFRHYVKCVKLFFANKNNKVDKNNNNNNDVVIADAD